MFKSILGSAYKDVLKKENNAYMFSEESADFIKYLIAIYRTPEGRDIRKGRYYLGS